MVATTAITIDAFLRPFVRDITRRGWMVEGAAAGLTGESALFSAVHDIGFARRSTAVFSHVRAALAVRRLLRRRRYDLVHLHTPIAAALTRVAVLTLPSRHRPVVMYLAHGFHFYAGAPRSAAAYRAVEQLLARVTDVVFTINREDFESARRIFNGEVHQLPGVGIDLEHFAPARVSAEAVAGFRSEWAVPPGRNVVAVVASLEPGKRHERLFDAIAGWDRAPVVLLAGAGPRHHELEALAASAGLAGTVRFLGQVDDVRTVLMVADCLALPSEREGLPRSVIEAMAMGTPVVGSDIRGVRDLLEGGAGVLVDTDDPVEFSEALEAACVDSSLRDGLVAAASARVRGLSEDVVLECHGTVIDRFDPRG